ncbi:MAG: hypothetical protein VKL39_20450 [Leptolyngbyaceae bacterium]|nr:hypothetical protein [Leptolyngbyaceae bacterium]
MKVSLSSISSSLRKVKVLAIAFLCVAVFVMNASPAFAAFGSKSSSHSSEGAAQLDETFQESEKAINRQPQSMSEVQSKAQKGPNEIQGDADMEKMRNSSNSSEDKSVEQQIKDAFDSVAN